MATVVERVVAPQYRPDANEGDSILIVMFKDASIRCHHVKEVIRESWRLALGCCT